MERNSSASDHSFRQESDNSIHTSLPDNWLYIYEVQMAHAHSVPQLKAEEVDLLATGVARGFNINEDDLDCPGHGRNGQMACSSSLEGLYDSSEDDSVSGARDPSAAEGEMTKARAMSIDDVRPDSDDDHNNNNNNAIFVIRDGMDDEEYESEQECDTPTVSTPKREASRFFKMERRASFDNGVFGMPDRILKGEMATERSKRHAVTAPGTPAEPGTPVARYLSKEDLLLDPEQVFNRIYSREYGTSDPARR